MTTSAIIAVIFVFVLIKHGMDTKAKQDKERLRVIEEALRHGELDDKTKEDLMARLTKRPEPPPPPRPVVQRSPHDVGFFMKFLAFIGWLTFCTGMAFTIICANTRHDEEMIIAATILSCAGFGLVTFPFVIRELQSPRRHAAEQRS